jgi:hypothetical protein
MNGTMALLLFLYRILICLLLDEALRRALVLKCPLAIESLRYAFFEDTKCSDTILVECALLEESALPSISHFVQ